jgi:hypothetical protein
VVTVSIPPGKAIFFTTQIAIIGMRPQRTTMLCSWPNGEETIFDGTDTPSSNPHGYGRTNGGVMLKLDAGATCYAADSRAPKKLVRVRVIMQLRDTRVVPVYRIIAWRN